MANPEQPTAEPEGIKPATPWWAWLFVVACIAIPVLSLGGAIPGAIGGGGAAACYGVAKNASMSVAMRVLICVGITFLCWVLFVLLMVLLVRRQVAVL